MDESLTIAPPQVSVLIPVYNAETTIKACLWSALNQSLEDIELVLYLDGCTDRSEEIISAFQDKRIRMIVSKTNNGIVHARNELVKAARAEFIAWLDADDIALPERLASQLEFMEVHPHIKILGTWVEVRGSRSAKSVRWPTNPSVLDAWMFFRNPLVQSSLMLRNKPGILDYNAEFEYLEDYELCSRFLGKSAVGIYPEFLCSYLEDSEKNRIDKYLRYDFVGKLEKIMEANFSLLHLKPGKNKLSLIREFLRNSKKLRAHDYELVKKFMLDVKKANRKWMVFDTEAMDGVVGYQMLRLAKASPGLIPGVFIYFLFRPMQLFQAMRCRVKYSN